MPNGPGDVDPIQAALDRWVESGRLADREAAFVALYREWLPIVRRLLPAGAPSADLDDMLQRAMLHGCGETSQGRIRVHAPPEVIAPRAWRTKVLRHAVLSARRKVDLRRHVEAVHDPGASAEANREALRERREAAKQPESPPPTPARRRRPPDERDAETEVAHRELVTKRREAALEALPRIAVRRRVLLALALEIDPSAWTEKLARALREHVADVQARIDAALSDADRDEAFHARSLDVSIPWSTVRVLYPDDPSHQAARKLLENAVKDLREHLTDSELVGGDP